MMSNQLAELDKQRKEAEEKRDDIVQQVEKYRNQGYDKEKEFNDLTKQFELEKEKEVFFQSEK
jgi:hypothetical protein